MFYSINEISETLSYDKYLFIVYNDIIRCNKFLFEQDIFYK